VNAVQNKICSKCKIGKPAILECFPPNQKAKDGLGSWCRDCYKEYQRVSRKNDYHRCRARLTYHKYRGTIKGFLTRVWNHVTSRCNNPNDVSYKYYGGRGIQCLFGSCSEFTDYIINELQVDPRGLQIHRINNNGNYESGNIEFLTAKVHYWRHK